MGKKEATLPLSVTHTHCGDAGKKCTYLRETSFLPPFSFLVQKQEIWVGWLQSSAEMVIISSQILCTNWVSNNSVWSFNNYQELASDWVVVRVQSFKTSHFKRRLQIGCPGYLHFSATWLEISGFPHPIPFRFHNLLEQLPELEKLFTYY